MTNLLSYVDYDFDVLEAQLVQRLQQNPDNAWKDTYQSATGEMLIQEECFAWNMAMYYLERRAEETYLPTAKLRSSVLALVELLGYIPRRAVSATGNLTFGLTAPLTNKVFIPRWSIGKTSGGVEFIVNADVVILAGQVSVLVDVTQGIKTEISTTSDGSPSFLFNINDTLVEDASLEVYVDNVEWPVTETFLTLGATDQYYRLKQETNDTISLLFGDGIRGKIPPVGSTVFIRYIKTLGLAGNIYSTAQVIILGSKIFDELGTDVSTYVTVTNGDALLGGDEAETTEDVRYLAPKVWKTGDRAVTREDYIAILEAYPGVANANAWGENEVANPDALMMNKVMLSILLQAWALPSTTYKATLGTYLETKAMLTVKYEFVDPVIVDVIAVLDAKVIQGNTLSQIQADIISELGAEFTLGTTTRLGQSKYLSDLVQLVNTLEGVYYHHMVLELYQDLIYLYQSPDQFGGVLSCVPIKPSTFKLYVGTLLVATDDGAGLLTSVASGYAFSGTSGLNYTNGHVGITFTAPSTPDPDEVSCRYQQNEDGDVVVTMGQICRLKQVEVTSIAYQT
jgi:hypothetical protein